MKPTTHILCLLALLLANSPQALSQKHDRHWVGVTNEFSSNPGKTVLMRFDEGDIQYEVLPGRSPTPIMEKGTIAMSDAAGRFQFYTNGNVVVSWTNTVMQGGKGFNKGAINDDFWSDSPWDSVPPDTTENHSYVPFAYQVIPDAYDEHIYYMIHSYVVNLQDDWYGYLGKGIQISKIDMSANGGRGRVVYKNRIFDTETRHASFAIIRHGNGKDWWVVRPSPNKISFKSLLLHRDSVTAVVQSHLELDTSWFTRSDRWVSSMNPVNVSEDGIMLADNYGRAYGKVLSFDRCSGSVTLLDTFTSGPVVVEDYPVSFDTSYYQMYTFSPSGRYLYGQSPYEYAQWDVLAGDIAASKVVLDGIPGAIAAEGQVYPYGTSWAVPHKVGPDGRMYNLSNYTHHVIARPDEQGNASEPCFAGVIGGSCLGVPYRLFAHWGPNYRLGALSGSACDTIPDEPVLPEAPDGGYGLSVTPSPASGPVTVEIALPSYDTGQARIVVVDMLGRVLYRHRFAPYAYLHEMDVSSWASGVYNVVLMEGNDLKASSRFVVIH